MTTNTKPKSSSKTPTKSQAPLPLPRKRNKDRAPDKTTVTFSLDREQQTVIKKLADSEKRTVSNWLQVILDKEIARRRAAGDDI
jgi:hypothetical protein